MSIEDVCYYATTPADRVTRELATQLLGYMETKANNHTQLERVGKRITWAVKEFFVHKLDSENPEFYSQDLVDFVSEHVPKVAPNSATRIMQNSRKMST